MPWFTWPLMPLALPGLIVAIRLLLPMVAVALTTSGVALNLYLVYRFGYPFRGEMTVSERPFRIDIDIFDGVYDDVPADASEKDFAKA
jgi:hypothetical protein